MYHNKKYMKKIIRNLSITSIISCIFYVFIIYAFIFVLRLCKCDVNHDRQITAYDIVLIQRFLDGYDDNLSLFDLYCMDVNSDFKITNEDIIEIQEHIVGLKKRGDK